jgi:hypothetical protein
LQKSH